MTKTVVRIRHMHDCLTYRYCVSEIPLWTRCAINHSCLSQCPSSLASNLHLRRKVADEFAHSLVGGQFPQLDQGQRISNGAWWRVVTK